MAVFVVATQVWAPGEGLHPPGGAPHVTSIPLVVLQLDTFFEARTLPENYTARNITVTVETIVRGLAYLGAFIFAANSAGMALLGERILQDPQGPPPSALTLRP